MLISPTKITEKLSKAFSERQSSLLAETIVETDVARSTDFQALTDSVQRLTENTTQLTQRIDSLVQAQERTEQRIDSLVQAQERTEQRIDSLVQAQERTEQRMDRLEIALEQLVQVQERTEQRIDSLVQTQERTEQRVGRLEITVTEMAHSIQELAQSQRRTEESLQTLISEHSITRKDLGGLTITVGYTLENEAYKHLPRVLQERYGITVQGNLRRDFVLDKHGNELEVNIYGQAIKDGQPIIIIGECKCQLSSKYIHDFYRKRIQRLEGVYTHTVPLLVTHMISSSEVRSVAQKYECLLFYSYDFD